MSRVHRTTDLSAGSRMYMYMYISLVKIAGTDSRMCWKIILDFIKFTHLSWLYSAEFVDLVWVDRCSDIFEAEFHDLFSKKNITNFGFKNFKALTFLKKFMECIGRRWIYSQNRCSWFWAGYCHSMLTLNQFSNRQIFVQKLCCVHVKTHDLFDSWSCLKSYTCKWVKPSIQKK